jgi:hypothetical protein
MQIGNEHICNYCGMDTVNWKYVLSGIAMYCDTCNNYNIPIRFINSMLKLKFQSKHGSSKTFAKRLVYFDKLVTKYINKLKANDNEYIQGDCLIISKKDIEKLYKKLEYKSLFYFFDFLSFIGRK